MNYLIYEVVRKQGINYIVSQYGSLESYIEEVWETGPARAFKYACWIEERI